MIQRTALTEFREPSASEEMDAVDAIIHSYVRADDVYGLEEVLIEQVLPALRKKATADKYLSFQPWDAIVHGAAFEMVRKWDTEAWGAFRKKTGVA